LGARKARQPASRRRVWVNGAYCESMAAGAREAGKILKREVKAWEIQKALAGAEAVKGVTVTEKPPVTRNAAAHEQKRAGGPLLRWPPGGKPLDRGVTKSWS